MSCRGLEALHRSDGASFNQVGIVATRDIGVRAQAALQHIGADLAKQRIVRIAGRPARFGRQLGRQFEQRDRCVEPGAEEERNRKALDTGGRRDDTVNRGAQIAVRGKLQQFADIGDQRAGDRLDVDPLVAIFDLQAFVVVLQQQGEESTVLVRADACAPKSKRSRRTIALDEETSEALRSHREAQLLERAFADDAYVDRDLVFADPLGGPIHPRRLTEWFGRHRKAAGVTTGTLHVLRHTHATLALTNGVPLHVVAARLGDRPETILQAYAHLLPTSDGEAAEQVAALIAG